MSEMIERAARAHNPVGWAWYDRAPDGHPAKPIFWEDEMRRARAAIEAMKEPTEAMKKCRAVPGVFEPDEARLVWMAMVEAALTASPSAAPPASPSPTDEAAASP